MLLAGLLIVLWITMLVLHPARAVAISVCSLLALAGVAALTLWLERVETRHLQQLETRIQLDEQCPAERPLRASVSNQSGHLAREVRWQLSAHLPGRQAELLTSPRSAEISLPEPLAAGERWQDCVDIPPLRAGYRLQDLEFSSLRMRARFD